MTIYGYLLNSDYTPKNGEVVWSFERYESNGEIAKYKGIKGDNLYTCEDYVIVGNSQEFREWLNTGFEPIFSIGFSGYALIPTSETKELYPSLPYEIDANGLEVVRWDIVYDNQYNYALAHLLTLVKTKYKPATLYPQNP